ADTCFPGVSAAPPRALALRALALLLYPPRVSRSPFARLECTVFRLFHAIIRTALIERFKSPFQISKSNLVFEKDVASKYSLRHRNWNTLAFRGRLMSLLELRSVGSHRGLSSRWSLAYSSCLAGLSFSTGCFTIPIHPIII